MRRTLLLLALACLAGVAPVRAGALREVQSIATVDDARAAWINPAATGTRHSAEWLAEGEWRGKRNQAWTAFGTLGALGAFVAEERVSPLASVRTWGASLSMGDERLRLGWSPYGVIARDGPGERRSDQRFGALTRPAPWLSLAGTLDHAFEPRTSSGVRVREWTLGAAVRPIAFDRARAFRAGKRLTLTGDATLRSGEARERAHTLLGLELEPFDGGAMRIAFAGHGEWRTSFTLRGVRNTTHATRAMTREDDGASRLGVAFHRDEERTLFSERDDQRVAVIRAGGVLADEAIGGGALGGGGSTVPSASLHRQLQRALEDPLTHGVLLDLRGVAGMAQLEELRPRVLALRAAGKPVVAFMEYGGGRGDLYLASACNRVFATEEATFVDLGMRVERRYWKRFLGGLGIKVERSSIGEFKSAYRNFSVDSMPAPDSLVIQHELDQRQALFLQALSEGRKLKPAQIEPFLDGRQWFAADLAAAGLIDSVGYRENALRELGHLVLRGDKPRTVNLARTREARQAWTVPTRIAVVYAGGGIEIGRSAGDLLLGTSMGSETVIAQLERAFHAPGVKAVVLRVDSPGGSALASNLIDHAIVRLMRETRRPLIVSMASVAASGGYYIACHADRIYADAHTRTGSIGVLFIKPSFEGLYARHGIRQEEFNRGAYMGGMSPARDWTPAMQAAADSAIGRNYRQFVSKVAEGRRMTFDKVEPLARGRVWMGADALEHGLVDEIGGLEAAIAEARRRGGIPPGEQIRLFEQGRPRGSFTERLIGGLVRTSLERELRLPDLDQVQARDPEVFEGLID